MSEGSPGRGLVGLKLDRTPRRFARPLGAVEDVEGADEGGTRLDRTRPVGEWASVIAGLREAQETLAFVLVAGKRREPGHYQAQTGIACDRLLGQAVEPSQDACRLPGVYVGEPMLRDQPCSLRDIPSSSGVTDRHVDRAAVSIPGTRPAV